MIIYNLELSIKKYINHRFSIRNAFKIVLENSNIIKMRIEHKSINYESEII
jgi:hypothetical protein